MKTKTAEAREVASFKKGMYKGMQLQKIAMRPNCMVILNKPSRIKNTLYYPDGTIDKEKGDASKS
jgi:hypothetical protein